MNNNLIQRNLYFGLLLLIIITGCLFIPGMEVFADDNQIYRYDHINLDINILKNGDMIIEEIQKLDYPKGTFQYAFRYIPLDRVESIDSVKVWDDSSSYPVNTAVKDWIETRRKSGTAPFGNVYAYSSWIHDNSLYIGWWFPATEQESRIFHISYTVHGGLRIKDTGDIIYWKAVFSDRDVQVNSSKITIHFPESIPTDKITAASYGITAQSKVIDSRTIEFTSGNIPAHTELEIQVIIPHGIFTSNPPSWQAEAEQLEAYNRDVKPWINIFLLLIGIIVIPAAGYFWLRSLLLRNKPSFNKNMVPTNIISPPCETPPALAGLLVHSRTSGLELTATIFDLAQRGVLHIEEIKQKAFIGFTSDLVIKKQSNATKYIFEKMLIEHIASAEGEYFSKKRRELYYFSREFTRQVEEEAVQTGLFIEKPSQSMKRLSMPGMWLSFVSIILGMILAIVIGSRAEMIFVPFFFCFILGLIAIALASKLPVKTENGAIEAASWKIFGKYLQQTLKQKIIADDTINNWDKYLPYAMVFGITSNWIKKFTELNAPAPSWFYAWSATGHSTQSSTDLNQVHSPLSSIGDAFTSMTNTISNTFTGGSSGSSSSGGGGGGGGGGSG